MSNTLIPLRTHAVQSDFTPCDWATSWLVLQAIPGACTNSEFLDPPALGHMLQRGLHELHSHPNLLPRYLPLRDPLFRIHRLWMVGQIRLVSYNANVHRFFGLVSVLR